MHTNGSGMTLASENIKERLNVHASLPQHNGQGSNGKIAAMKGHNAGGAAFHTLRGAELPTHHHVAAL
jgi:microcystin-dependent protein